MFNIIDYYLILSELNLRELQVEFADTVEDINFFLDNNHEVPEVITEKHNAIIARIASYRRKHDLPISTRN